MKDVSNLKTIMKQVIDTLDTFPETRNSDTLLAIKLWQSFYFDYLSNDMKSIDLMNLFMIPKETTIVRCRAKVQNELKIFMPTDPEIAKARGILEEDWKKALGYHIEENGQLTF